MIQQAVHRDDVDSVAAGTILLHDGPAAAITSVRDLAAAHHLFADSRWCLRRNPWFEGYLRQGPILLLKSKLRLRDYLLAPAHAEFRNRRNRRVSLAKFVDEHPEVYRPLRLLGIFWGAQWCDHKGIWYCPTANSRDQIAAGQGSSSSTPSSLIP